MSGHIKSGKSADLVSASHPDTVTNTTASGSTALSGADNFSFTGQITALALTGGSGRVYVDGQEINPAAIPATTLPPTNTTGYLTLPANTHQTASYRQTSLDISTTFALDAHGLHGRFRQLTLDERFGRTDTTQARRAQFRATADKIETRITQLHKRQAAAITAYNNGSISTHEFLRELVRIDATAGRLTTAVDRLAARARSIPRSSINGRPVVSWAQNRRIELGLLQGPVRTQLAETFRGNNTMRIDLDVPTGLMMIDHIRSQRVEPLLVYVETSPNGVVLATVADGQYYREVVFSGERNATGSRLTGSADVLRRMHDLYPWAANNSGYIELSSDRRTGISRVTLFHDHGHLTIFLDKRTGRVIAEHQQKSLSKIPTAKPITATEGNLRLRVMRTHPTGPVNISLSTLAGDPIDGTVIINGRTVGKTGTDGQLWTIAPQRTVTIVARANGETIRIRIDNSTFASSTSEV